MKVICPKCGREVWDKASADQRLNKCWGCGLRFDNEEEGGEVEEVTELVYRFPVRERLGDQERDYTVVVHHTDLREAIVQAAMMKTEYDENRAAALEDIAEQLGKEDWTPAEFFKTNPDFYRGDYLVSIYMPDICVPGDTPKEVLRRAVSHAFREGQYETLGHMLNAVIDALGDDELERLFRAEIRNQRGLEGGRG